MKRISLFQAGLAGGLTGVVMIALTYLGQRLANLPFMPFDIFDWMTRHLPGGLINFAIASMVQLITALKLGPTASTAKLAENGIGLVQFVIGGIILGVILGYIGRRRSDDLVSSGVTAGLIVSALMVFFEATYRFTAAGPMLSIIWLVLIFTGWGAVLARLIQVSAPQAALIAPQPVVTAEPDAAQPQKATVQVVSSAPPGLRRSAREDLSRRQFLTLVGAGSFTVLVGAAGLRLSDKPANIPETGVVVPTKPAPLVITSGGAAASPSQSVLDARFKPVTRTRAELTPNDQFYRIDINSDPPVIDGSTWRMQFDGLVANPLRLSLSDISAKPSITQAVTMSCISNELGGDLVGTTLWTGVPFKDILAEAGLKPGVTAINIKAIDGFYESVPIAEAMDGRTMLVYQMNGQALSIEHGFPLRIYIPNHFGMKQPKWITSMEAASSLGAGYWVDRGWSATAIAQTTSVIDNVAVDQRDPKTGMIPIGGIAWAGARGISKVEIQIDDGSWDAAELRTPPLSPLTWVQWRYFWKASTGHHKISVHAYDGQGVLQVTDSKPTYPDGATGIDAVAEDITS